MIAICPNPFRDLNYTLSQNIYHHFCSNNIESCVCPVFKSNHIENEANKIPLRELSEVAAICSALIVIGGDGTILAVARQVYKLGIPIIAVNMGTKGFMASIEAGDPDLMNKVSFGRYRLSQRMMLDISLLRNGNTILNDTALNDAVIRGYVDTIDIHSYCNHQLITSFSGDGIIVASPTGSTGYSMSAGGPILEPEAEALILSPICAHTMSERSFVLSSKRIISVTPGKLHDRKAYLSIDGRIVCDVHNGDQLLIQKSKYQTILADFEQNSFYDIAYQKLR